MTNELTRSVRDAMPFASTIGLEVVESTGPDELRGVLRWAPALTTTGGALHGGACMGAADACGGVVAFRNLPDGATGTSTIESKTNFFRPVREGSALIVSRPIHLGRTTIVVDSELYDEGGRLVARVTQTQAVLR